MLNVARILARSERRVVMVELDLEAPGVIFDSQTGFADIAGGCML